MGMRVQIADGDIDDPGKELPAQPAHDALAEPRADQALQQLTEAVERIGEEHRQHGARQAARRGARDDVNRAALQARRVHAKKRAQHDDEQHAANHAFFLREIHRQPLYGRAHVLRVLDLGKPLSPVQRRDAALGRPLLSHAAPPLPSANRRYPDRRRRRPSARHACRRRRCARPPARRCGPPGEPMRSAAR